MGNDLQRQHRDLLRASAIPPALWRQRRYWSASEPRQLRKLGFGEQQSALVPGLVIPIWDMFGQNTRCQLRPDRPRLDHVSGRPRKYENLPGVGVALDVHPRARVWVKDSKRVLFITEGVRKGDAAVAQGQACIALYSVWNWRGTDESGAVMALGDWEMVPLPGRQVYVVFDSDVMTKLSVQLALERLVRFLSRRGAVVRPVYLPPGAGGEKQGLDDWFAAGHDVDGLLEHAEDTLRGLPAVIVSGRQLRDITKDAVDSIAVANDPPQVYRYAQGLARVRVDESGRPFIEHYEVASLKSRLTAVADFYRLLKNRERIPVSPTDELARTVLAQPEWTFPVLESIVETPTVRADGTILDQPGYDPRTGLVYVPEHDFTLPRVPENPPLRWRNGARRLLLELLEDFPFVDEASRANALALLLTPMVRPAIRGPVPMALIDAPQAGTGKSLLAEAVAMTATGRNAEMMSPCRDDEEWRKQITATLIKGPSLVVVDNLMGRVTSAAVARALTATTWKDRILGQSLDAVVPQRATWIATGNNILLGGDLPRRATGFVSTPRPLGLGCARSSTRTPICLPGYESEPRPAASVGSA